MISTMMGTGQFLKEGLQIGPWRITRKILLLVIAFCLVILCFGVMVLETHVFEPWSSENDDDDWDSSNEDEDGYEFGNGASGGDWAMIFIMVCAGIVGAISGLACCFAQANAPRQFRSSGRDSVYTIEGNNKNTTTTSTATATTTTSGTPRTPTAPSTVQQWPHIQHQQSYQYNIQQQMQQDHQIQLQQQQQQQQLQQHQQLQQEQPTAWMRPPPPYSGPSAPPHQLNTIAEQPPPYVP